MLGRSVRDPSRIESDVERADGLKLIPIETELRGQKTLRQVSGIAHAAPGFWSCLVGQPVTGYEIHLGVSQLERLPPLLDLNGRPDGAVRRSVAGTYVHGILERPEPRHALLAALAAARGFARPTPTAPDNAFDRLADVIENSLDLSGLQTLAKLHAHQRD
jgi:adenosylcobyric acid synthase